MKAAFVVLLLVFSFSAHSAKESSALERLKAIPTELPQCKLLGAEIDRWNLKTNGLSKENFGRAIEILNTIPFPSTDNLETVRAALSEDPAGAMPDYLNHGSCAMVRSQLATSLIDFSGSKTAYAQNRESVKSALKRLLQAPKYEFFIEAMVDASILSKVYAAKLFSEGSGAKEMKSLEASKAQMKKDAKAYQDKMNATYPDLDNPALKGKELSEKLRSNKNYEKVKGAFLEEAQSAGRGLQEIRDLAAALK